MGRKEEAIKHLRKSLEIRETILTEEDPRDLAFIFLELAEQYAGVGNHKEALPFCLKALDKHIELGSDPHVVALVRTLLDLIYAQMGEHSEASKQNELSGKLLQWYGSYDALVAKIDVAKMLIAEGRRYEAKAVLVDPINSTHIAKRPGVDTLELQKKFEEARELWRSL